MTRFRRRSTITALVLTTMTGAAVSGPAAAVGVLASPHVTRYPTVTGPITGGLHGTPFDASVIPLHPQHYREAEYFVSGVAAGGGKTALPTVAVGTAPKPYRTRILVRVPTRNRFNGTVLVEWFNVTSQHDYDADWSEGYREILRGYAYVGVSAQQVGVQSLTSWDPSRYGSLSHPGDTYSASIYAQILRLVRRPHGVNPLAGLRVRHIIADGHSQSGIALHAFVDSVQRSEHLADGFLIRGDGTTAFDLRHLRTPVLQYQSEAEIDGPVAELQRHGASAAPAHDSPYYRLWQVAGATHTGSEGAFYLFSEMLRDYALLHTQWNPSTQGRYDGSGAPTCPSSLGIGALDEYPQWYSLDAAIHVLNHWVTHGQPPPHQRRIRVTPANAIVRDRFGNARGGVRSPVVDVPIATYHGDEGCPLSGVTTPLPAATLHRLYPTHTVYVAAMRRDIARLERAGVLLRYDGRDLLARAEHP